MTEGINDGGHTITAPSPRVASSAAATANSGAPGDDDAPAVAITTPRGGDSKQSFDPSSSSKQSKLSSVGSSPSNTNSNNNSNDDSSDVPSRSLYLGGIRAEQTSYYDLCRLANYVGFIVLSYHTIPPYHHAKYKI